MRYRLQGVRYDNGEVSIQPRPQIPQKRIEQESPAVREFTQMMELAVSTGRERKEG